ncbi:snare region anchored in the vesicle membrane C-terminus-domain-containing protein [Phlyctochytrium arcticum]|nr:snare region anchored in the vesicle membrane C-terminus-domain-containing protein [Phlyctochytrium arcticum]
MSSTILYNTTTKQIHHLQQDLVKLESGEDTSAAIQGSLTAGLATLQRGVNELEAMAKREVSGGKRETAMARAKKVRLDFNDISSAFGAWKSAQREKQSAHDRAALLSDASGSAFDSASLQRRTASMNPHETAESILAMDAAIKDHTSLTNSGQNVEEYINMGRNVLQDLVEQREMLKGTQRRLYDAANTLGLSTSVIRMIERRSAADKIILLSGMTGTVILMWAIVHYWG